MVVRVSKRYLASIRPVLPGHAVFLAEVGFEYLAAEIADGVLHLGGLEGRMARVGLQEPQADLELGEDIVLKAGGLFFEMPGCDQPEGADHFARLRSMRAASDSAESWRPRRPARMSSDAFFSPPCHRLVQK